MGEEQRQELARLFAESEEFKAAIMGAASVEEAVRIAGHYGVDVTAEELERRQSAELGDAELDVATGGRIFYYPTDPSLGGC